MSERRHQAAGSRQQESADHSTRRRESRDPADSELLTEHLPAMVSTTDLSNRCAPQRAPQVQHQQRADGNQSAQRMVQRMVEGQAPATQSNVRGQGGDIAARLQSRAGLGQNLDSGVQGRLEEHFGVTLYDVGVHTDTEANALCSNLQAGAFTLGEDIFFAEGAYSPGTEQGDRLIGHEVTHVLQQAAGPVDGGEPVGGLSISHPDDKFERAADKSADAALTPHSTLKAPGFPSPLRSGGRVSTTNALTIQRSPPFKPQEEPVPPQIFTEDPLLAKQEEYQQSYPDYVPVTSLDEFGTVPPMGSQSVIGQEHYDDWMHYKSATTCGPHDPLGVVPAGPPMRANTPAERDATDAEMNQQQKLQEEWEHVKHRDDAYKKRWLHQNGNPNTHSFGLGSPVVMPAG